LDAKIHRLDIDRFRKEIKAEGEDRKEKLNREKEKRRRDRLQSINPLTSKPSTRRLIGSGSFGIVYLANYERRKVAVKKIAPDHNHNPADIDSTLQNEVVMRNVEKPAEKKRSDKNSSNYFDDDKKDSTEAERKQEKLEDLLYEAEMLRVARYGSDAGDKKRINHHIVELFAVDSDPRGPQLVMEFITGGNLAAELLRAAQNNTDSIFHPDNPKNLLDKNEAGIENPVLFQIVRIAKCIASALEKIHEAGIIHLDVAARNIFLDAYKRPKLGDFGSAVEQQAVVDIYHESRKRLLVDNVARRKYEIPPHRRPVAWMPDWVVLVQDRPLLDWHADVYSFGCVLFEMVTKSSPYSGATNEEILHRKKCGEGNPQIPKNTDATLMSMMEDCWAVYKDQPPMLELYTRLNEFHEELKCRESGNNSTYKQLRDLIEGLKESDEFSIVVLENNDPHQEEDKVRNKKKFEVEAAELSSVITSALHCRDFNTISRTIKFTIAARDPRISEKGRVDALCQCMEALSCLAEDAHASIDEKDTWKELCSIIVHAYLASSRELEISADMKKNIIVSSLKALSKVIQCNVNRVYLKEDVEELHIFTIIFELYGEFTHDAEIMEANAELTKTVSLSSNEMSELLYQEKMIPQLIKCMHRHSLHPETVLSCLKTLGTFSMDQLLNPNGVQQQQVFEDAEMLRHRWQEAFTAIFEVINECVRENFPKDKIAVLETALLMLFRASEKSSFNKEKLEHFFYSVNAQMIKNLLMVVREYPQQYHFRIQEGAIGLLSHILQTGNNKHVIDPSTMTTRGSFMRNSMTSLNVAVDEGRIEIPFVTTNEDRVKALIAEDKNFKLLLGAMERFQIDERVLEGIQDAENKLAAAGTPGNTNNVSAASSVASTLRGTVGFGTTNTTFSKSIVQFTASGIGAAFAEGYRQGMNEGIVDYSLYLDAEGEEITAASLQKSVAIILGQTCLVMITVQNDLLRTRYNELILKAFDTFRNDVDLVYYGSLALYYTCRRNIRQQRSLYRLNIVRHLSSVFAIHSSTEYLVAEGIIKTLIGLLEPDKENNNPKETNECSEFCASLTRPTSTGCSALQDIALRITYFMLREECMNLTSVFLKLVGCCLYWQPNLLESWWKPETLAFRTKQEYQKLPRELIEIILDKLAPEEFVDFANRDYFQAITKSMMKELGRLAGYEAAKSLISTVAVKQQLTNFDSISGSGVVDGQPQPGTVEGNINNNTNNSIAESLPSVPGGGSEEKKTAAAVSPPRAVENRTDKRTEVTARKAVMLLKLFRKCSLYDFVMFSMVHQSKSEDVIGLGMSLIVTMIRRQLLPTYHLGQDIEYNGEKAQNLWWCRCATLASLFPHFCMFAEREQTQNVLVIRYTLWLFIICISEKRGRTGTNPGTDVAAEIAIQGGLEWSIEIMRQFPHHYSLQCLATVFLTWMEYHGRFMNRSIEKLTELREMINTLLSYGGIETNGRGEEKSKHWKTLEEECEDRILMDSKLVEVFGDIKEHARKLLKLVDEHINENKPVEIGKIAKKHVQFQGRWDGQNRPYSARVISTEKEEIPGTRKIRDVYTIQVVWENESQLKGKSTAENKWKLSKTYKEFEEFQKKILDEFTDVANCFTKVIPGERMFFKVRKSLSLFFFLRCFKFSFQLFADFTGPESGPLR
jgi:serine/threonine protein kinase